MHPTFPYNPEKYSIYKVIRRNGTITEFNPQKITNAIAKAFDSIYGFEVVNRSQAMQNLILEYTEQTLNQLIHRIDTHAFHLEMIQDEVEKVLMHGNETDVAKSYIMYREDRKKRRLEEQKNLNNLNNLNNPSSPNYQNNFNNVDNINGSLNSSYSFSEKGIKSNEQYFDFSTNSLTDGVIDFTLPNYWITTAYLTKQIKDISHDLKYIDISRLVEETKRNMYQGISLEDTHKSLILSARSFIEQDPEYSLLCARLLLLDLHLEIEQTLNIKIENHDLTAYFPVYIQAGIDAELLDERLNDFDLKRLAQELDKTRDDQFTYLGLQTLYDRYFLHIEGKRIEQPQSFFMRVAMGLALNENDDKNDKAIEFYNVLSSFAFMSSTPTLFNAGTRHSQLSSCYLTTIGDDLAEIYEGYKENALLSKFAGGLGNDWSNVRALGAKIKGTNGESQGIVPFLKVANDTAVAVNQGGKRRGAVCAYLETWHLDIEEFLDLRKNTGDERRRTHDMNTANWIPDLFMQRLMEDGQWSLFSPNETPDLHDTYGAQFKERYEHYEALGKANKLRQYKQISATQLWRKMLTMLFETGHPWVTFKDPCNIGSPQKHQGVVHSSNLCTEITLNTNEEEIAVCNLGSINLLQHIHTPTTEQRQYLAELIQNGASEKELANFIAPFINQEKLRQTTRIAMNMLDNVIDINFYPVEKARISNMRHRPVGLGCMGFQDCLYALNIPFASYAMLCFTDMMQECVSYFAFEASSDLAAQKGTYATYEGSSWSQGLFPIDNLKQLQNIRQETNNGVDVMELNFISRLDWQALKDKVAKQGMRNSNCLAIAPTATISNIIGVYPCIEPTYQNLYVKSNLSGEFTVINSFLVNDLKALNLWNKTTVYDLKYFDGSVQTIEYIPQHLKDLYATSFEIDTTWVIYGASRRQKWIDQSQSINIFMAGASGKKLDETYKLAWKTGLKTTYYLRSLAATSSEKSTLNAGALNGVKINKPIAVPVACRIDEPDCEACQ